jgi:hypothetical protein
MTSPPLEIRDGRAVYVFEVPGGLASLIAMRIGDELTPLPKMSADQREAAWAALDKWREKEGSVKL